MIRLANERHNIIANARAQLWVFKNVVTREGQTIRRFHQLALDRDEIPGLALSWTLYHTVDEASPLHGLSAVDMEALTVSLIVVLSGYDVVAAQTIHARKSYEFYEIKFGHRYVDILDTQADGRLRIDYGRFHETLEVTAET